MIHKSYMEWLHNERSHERLDNYVVYDGYYNGNHEVDIPAKVKAALESELGTVSNFCRVVVDAAVDYILGGKIGVEVIHDETNEDRAAEAEQLLNDVWGENDLFDEEMIKTATIMGKKGDVFLKLYAEDGDIKIRVLRPDLVFPQYRSDDYKEMTSCAIKFFDDSEGEGKWKAQVFRLDVVEYYELDGKSESESTLWVLVKTEDNPLGFIPIVHVKNSIDDLEFGVSDIQVMADLQDLLNKTITDLALTMDNTAFQRVFVFGGQTVKGQELSMEPGSIYESQNAEGHMDIIEAAKMEPFIETLKEIKSQISSVTSIPETAFNRTEAGLPPSGYSLRVAYIPLEGKAGKKRMILVNRFSTLNDMIFEAAKILGMDDFTEFKSTVHFTGGLPVDETAEIEVQEKELLLRIKSRRTVMQERGIEDVDAEMERIKEEEAGDNVNGARVRQESVDTRTELERFANSEVPEEV